MFSESIFIPLVDSLLEQVETLTSRRYVEYHEEDEGERNHDGNCNANPVEELKVGVDELSLGVGISNGQTSSCRFHSIFN